MLSYKLLNDLSVGRIGHYVFLLTKLNKNTASDSDYRLFDSLDIWYNHERSKRVIIRQRQAETRTFQHSDLHGIDVSAHIPRRDVVEYGGQVERKQE